MKTDFERWKPPRKECGGGWPRESRAWRAWFPAGAHAMFTRKARVGAALTQVPIHSADTTPDPSLVGRLGYTDTAGVTVRQPGDTSTIRLPHRRGRNQPFPLCIWFLLPASTSFLPSFPLSLLSQSPTMGDSDSRRCSILSGRNKGAIVLPPICPSIHPSIHPFHPGPFMSHFILLSSPKLTALVRRTLPLEYTVIMTQISVGNPRADHDTQYSSTAQHST